MCLSTVYELGTNGAKKKLCEYVSAIRVAGDTVIMTDIMGEELSVSGSLETVDLVKNTIIISAKAGKVAMKKYEMVREIFNSCANNQMRDVDIRDVETDDVDASVQEFLIGEHVHAEKIVQDNGSVVFDINTDGLQQRVTFTELAVQS
ncbi:MAG: CooT family nickel-binding protein [Treponema sp.]|jgi:predicted RNA-binding protein|nr:CooT family nickel-binding protein [Treponema sp.]